MWFNLAGIFKEIKEYEESKGNQSTDQFQDLLRAHELPSIVSYNSLLKFL